MKLTAVVVVALLFAAAWIAGGLLLFGYAGILIGMIGGCVTGAPFGWWLGGRVVL